MIFKRSKKVRIRFVKLTACLLIVGIIGFVWLWSKQLPKLKVINEIQVKNDQVGVHDFINFMSFSSDGTLLASGGSSGVIQVTDMSTFKPIYNFNMSRNSITGIVFSPRGYNLGVGTSTSSEIWDARKGKLEAVSLLVSIRTTNAFTPDGTNLIVNCNPGFGSWDYRNNNVKKIIELGDFVFCSAISPDTTLLATGDWPEKVALYDLRSKKLLRSLPFLVRPTSGGVP